MKLIKSWCCGHCKCRYTFVPKDIDHEEELIEKCGKYDETLYNVMYNVCGFFKLDLKNKRNYIYE